MAKRQLITTAVMDTEDNNDNNLVYIKGHEKREWLRDLLQDNAREDVYIENIDEYYEDMESLNKLNVTHTLRCQKHVTNCALYKMYSNYLIGGINVIKNKHILSTNMILFLYLLFPPLYINYFIIAYHTFVSHNFRKKNKKKHDFFYKINLFLTF